MKKLTLVRHSLACKPSKAIDDRTRYLTNEGIEVIKQISPKLKKEFINNSFQTAIEFMVNNNAYDNVKLIIDPFVYDLYNFNELVFNVLTKYEKHNNLWIFGHNPALTNIATALLNRTAFMKKCSVIHFKFNVDKWDDISNLNLIDSNFIDSEKD